MPERLALSYRRFVVDAADAVYEFVVELRRLDY